MSKRSRFEGSRHYFNEYKSFPIEKLFIPFIIAGALLGLYYGWKVIAKTRSPTAAAERVMTALKLEDAEELGSFIRVTPEQDHRLEYGGGLEVYAKEIITLWKQKKVSIVSFKVQDAKQNGDDATVPIAATVRSDKDGSSASRTVYLKMSFFGGKWRYWTKDLRATLGLPPDGY